MKTAIVKKDFHFKFGQSLLKGTKVVIIESRKDGNARVKRAGVKSLEYLVSLRDLKTADLLKNYAVVLAWDTESDAGMGTILVGVKAKNDKAALKIAMKQAANGTLYTKLYKDVEPQEIKVDENNSFACLVKKLSYIN